MCSTLKEQRASLTHYSLWVLVYALVCMRVIHRGESDTVSLPAWQAALSPSSEWKPIWQITSSRQSAHPSPGVLSLFHSSLSLLVLFVWHLSSPLLKHHWPPSPPPSHPFPPHTHSCKKKRKKRPIAHNLGPSISVCLAETEGSQLSIFMSPALQVNCLRDSAVMNIRFETRGGREGGIGWEGDGEKKKKKWRAGENADLVLRPRVSTSAVCHSPPFFPLSFSPSLFIFTPGTLRSLFSSPFTSSPFLHTYSPLAAAPTYPPIFLALSHSLSLWRRRMWRGWSFLTRINRSNFIP